MQKNIAAAAARLEQKEKTFFECHLKAIHRWRNRLIFGLVRPHFAFQKPYKSVESTRRVLARPPLLLIQLLHFIIINLKNWINTWNWSESCAGSPRVTQYMPEKNEENTIMYAMMSSKQITVTARYKVRGLRTHTHTFHKYAFAYTPN